MEGRGESQAAILLPTAYQRLIEASEELDDIVVFDAAMTEEGLNIPWAQVEADLGW